MSALDPKDLGRKKDAVSGMLQWFRNLNWFGKLMLLFVAGYIISPLDIPGPIDDIFVSIVGFGVMYLQTVLFPKR